MTPAEIAGISVLEPAALMAGRAASSEANHTLILKDDTSFLSDPHIWRFDPPPRH